MVVSRFDDQLRRVIHRAVNACLAPLASVADAHVLTVEGLGSLKRGVHPVVRGRVAARWGRRVDPRP